MKLEINVVDTFIDMSLEMTMQYRYVALENTKRGANFMKLLSKRPYIDYLIVQLHSKFIVEASDREVSITRKMKWFQRDKNYLMTEKDENKVIDENLVLYMLAMICRFEQIEYLTYGEWIERNFSNEIELY